MKESPLEYAAIITVSGDGLIHEVINGLSHHGNPIKALSTPVAPIPAGSGNGLSLNLLGIKVILKKSSAKCWGAYSLSRTALMSDLQR